MWDITEDVQHTTLCIYRIGENTEEEEEEEMVAEAAVAVQRYEYSYAKMLFQK